MNSGGSLAARRSPNSTRRFGDTSLRYPCNSADERIQPSIVRSKPSPGKTPQAGMCCLMRRFKDRIASRRFEKVTGKASVPPMRRKTFSLPGCKSVEIASSCSRASSQSWQKSLNRKGLCVGSNGPRRFKSSPRSASFANLSRMAPGLSLAHHKVATIAPADVPAMPTAAMRCFCTNVCSWPTKLRPCIPPPWIVTTALRSNSAGSLAT